MIPGRNKCAFFIQRWLLKTSGQKNSTGLGLAITAAIIREHSGQITLDSTPGEGVIIHSALPVESHEADETFDEMKEA